MQLTVNGSAAYVYLGGKQALNEALPAVVFIHGAEHDHSVWILQSRYLAHHGYRVLAVDLPGHARSTGLALESVGAMADWIIAVLAAAGVDQATLVGHSMGSLIALDAAARYPNRVTGLVLVGAANPMKVGELLLNATRDDEPAAQDMVNIWSHASAHAHKPSNPGPGFWVIGQNLRLMQRINQGVMHTDFFACNAYADGATRATQVTCPTLAILGKRDAMTPAKSGRALAQSIAGTQVVEIASSGHNLMGEAPDAVLDALVGFLATAPIKPV